MNLANSAVNLLDHLVVGSLCIHEGRNGATCWLHNRLHLLLVAPGNDINIRVCVLLVFDEDTVSAHQLLAGLAVELEDLSIVVGLAAAGVLRLHVDRQICLLLFADGHDGVFGRPPGSAVVSSTQLTQKLEALAAESHGRSRRRVCTHVTVNVTRAFHSLRVFGDFHVEAEAEVLRQRVDAPGRQGEHPLARRALEMGLRLHLLQLFLEAVFAEGVEAAEHAWVGEGPRAELAGGTAEGSLLGSHGRLRLGNYTYT